MENNAHVMEFCMDYINSQSNPEYALLLKGPWGCGKTFFVERLKERLISDQDEVLVEENIWHISIFGVNTIEELEDKFFEAAHPIISSESGKKILTIGYKIVRSAVKHKYGLDPNDLGVKDTIKTGKIGEDCKLIIIDDIERSGLSPTQLFGYMLEIILKDKVRVIFIGNEDEFSKNFSESDREYAYVREKVIGYTLNIKPEYELAVDVFIKELNLKKVKVDNIRILALDILKK